MLSLLAAFAVLSVKILACFFCLDFLWNTPRPSAFFLKASFSIGLGLGVSSLAYFPYLALSGGSPRFFYFELAAFLTALAVWLWKRRSPTLPKFQKPTRLQIAFAVPALLVFFLSARGLFNYAFARQEGDWDAWMIYNRTARFIFRSGEFWRDAFSADMDTIFHPDYPPMLALNIVSVWDALKQENTDAPLALGLLFSLACVFAFFAALASLKSFSQASLGVILLWGTGAFVYEGGRQMADMPLAFFMLAGVAFFYLHTEDQNPILAVMSGFSAGLAAWTKNEGFLFAAASFTALVFLALQRRSWVALLPFLAGLALPFGAALYFKAFISPPSEFAGENAAALLLDPARYQAILVSFRKILMGYGPEKFRFFLPLLAAYTLLAFPVDKTKPYGYVLLVLAFQFAGYYFFYLISPYDLDWHITFSISRLFAQTYPIVLFAALYIARTPEELFVSTGTAP